MHRKIMTKFEKKTQNDIGLSPYELIYRGTKQSKRSIIHCMSFNNELLEELEIKSIEEVKPLINSSQLSWLNVYGINNPELMEALGDELKMEKNIMADVMNTLSRPKIQELERSIHISVKMLHYAENSRNISAENLSLIVTNNSLISFQEQSYHFFDPIRDRIRKHKNKIRSAGNDYLAFALLDVVVDNYIYAIGMLGDKIEDIDEQLSNDLTHETLEKINFYKRELNFVRKNIKPAKEVILALNKLDSDFIKPENQIHFRELQDNINEAIDLADSYHEILYDLLNIYHSSVSTKLNEIMRVLTIISVIFIPITFLVGVYGTNFENIPELHFRHGYAILWLLMILISLSMIWFFRRKKWL
jgi:magnesium transporter